MKRIIRNVALISLLSAIYITGQAQSNQELRALVAQMNKDLIEMAKAGRFEAMAKYYDPNAISLPNYRAMEKGFKLILNNNQGRMKGGYKILSGEKNTNELIAGIDMMVDIGSYALTYDFPGLSAPREDMGKYMNVWKKDKEGNWRIVAETWNADKSPNAPDQSKVSPGSPMRTSSGMDSKDNMQPAMDTKDGKK